MGMSENKTSVDEASFTPSRRGEAEGHFLWQLTDVNVKTSFGEEVFDPGST